LVRVVRFRVDEAEEPGGVDGAADCGTQNGGLARLAGQLGRERGGG